MLSIKEAVNGLESNDRFQAWKEENSNTYLCHCMQMMNEADDSWYLGYYNKTDDKITTFIISATALSKESTEKVFKEPGKTVEELKIDQINISYKDALDLAKETCTKNYPTDLPSKNIVIVQTLEKTPTFNITFVTLAMSTVNIKINAETKELISHKKTSLMELDASKEYEEKLKEAKKENSKQEEK